MSPIPPVTQPVLVYNRIAQNRRKSILLVALAVVMTIPFLIAVSFGVSELFVAQFAPRTGSRAAEDGLRRALALRRNSAEPETEYSRELDRQLQLQFDKMREQRERDMAAVDRFRSQMMMVVSGGLTALLGLLFWSLASSPASKILSMCGAVPAGASEKEAKRILENLAIGAGLPTPKLYVINSTNPNAFAAGADPQRAVIAVTQGLLTLLDHRELEGVLAHELSHIGNHDTRLNTTVAALALFLRLPYLLLKRRLDEASQNHYESLPLRRRGGWYRLVFTVAMIPAIIYVFVIAPFLAALIRSAISRSREFLADADAALLTRSPEGLLRALAKIGGAGSVVAGSNPVISHLYFADPATPGLASGIFKGSLLATHPPLQKRIARLMEFNGGVPASELEVAIREGVEFTRLRPVTGVETIDPIKQDELSALTAGNPMGRVFRVLSATAIYDRPDPRSFIVARARAGDLLVVFDDPGKFRQVLNHDQTFGYMPAFIKLQKVDMLPAEIHDPAARAAAQAATPLAAEKSASSAADAANEAAGPPSRNLTPKQLVFAAGLGIVVFAGLFMAMLTLGNH